VVVSRFERSPRKWCRSQVITDTRLQGDVLMIAFRRMVQPLKNPGDSQ